MPVFAESVFTRPKALGVLSVAAVLLLSACSPGGSSTSTQTGSAPPSGGSPSGGGNTPPSNPPSSAPSFSPGVFEPSSSFEQRCENPRTGLDIEGNPFPDIQGSLIEELFWLRSWSQETYLFNDEITDQDPALFDGGNINDRLTYFDELRTFRTTASGRFVDEFHFTEPTTSFLERRNSTPVSGYGVRFEAFSTTPPRDFRVRYTEANSPASQTVLGQPNFVRGSRILEIDGADFVNGTGDDVLATLNAGLFPAFAGETHTFVLQDPGSSTPRTIQITSADVAPTAVNRTRIISTPTGDVGYMLVNSFSPFASEREIAEAISGFAAANVSDLVIDIRYNGGGLLATAAQLAFAVAGPAQSAGRTFELLRFNNAPSPVDPVNGFPNDPFPFADEAFGFSLPQGTPLDSLDLPRVFILSTDETCSASESIINGLRGINVEVVLIGNTTCGKPFGFFPTDNCGVTYFTIQFQGTNDVGFGDYSDGFIPANSTAAFGVRAPGCVVEDDFNNELGNPAEALLAAALQFREDGTCPPLPVTAERAPPTTLISSAPSAKAAAPGTRIGPEADPIGDFLAQSRDLTMPR